MGVKSVISSTSEFSIVQSQTVKSGNSIFSGKTQKSINRIGVIGNNQRDTYVEDIVTQKIIYYISLFSDEVSDSLDKLRKQGVLTDYKQKDAVKGDVDEFMISLDDVDMDFINVILGILDYYELFKLAMLLCNRYKLSDRIGLYILQISSKYSNIYMFRYNLDYAKQISFNNVYLPNLRRK
jgi:hypothetical protein